MVKRQQREKIEKELSQTDKANTRKVKALTKIMNDKYEQLKDQMGVEIESEVNSDEATEVAYKELRPGSSTHFSKVLWSYDAKKSASMVRVHS